MAVGVLPVNVPPAPVWRRRRAGLASRNVAVATPYRRECADHWNIKTTHELNDHRCSEAKRSIVRRGCGMIDFHTVQRSSIDRSGVSTIDTILRHLIGELTEQTHLVPLATMTFIANESLCARVLV